MCPGDQLAGFDRQEVLIRFGFPGVNYTGASQLIVPRQPSVINQDPDNTHAKGDDRQIIPDITQDSITQLESTTPA